MELKAERLIRKLLTAKFSITVEVKKSSFTREFVRNQISSRAGIIKSKEQEDYISRQLRKKRIVLSSLSMNTRRTNPLMHKDNPAERPKWLYGAYVTIPENKAIQWREKRVLIWIKGTDITKRQRRKLESLLEVNT